MVGSFTLSPCNSDCFIESNSKLCRGCFRTIEEIVQWHSLEYDKKKKILELVEKRKREKVKRDERI